MVSVAVDRERVSGFEGLWTQATLVVARTVHVLNMISNVLFSSASLFTDSASI